MDAVFDFLLAVGRRPLVGLSFMPAELATGERTSFITSRRVTPPRDYGAWRRPIGVLASISPPFLFTVVSASSISTASPNPPTMPSAFCIY
ncbi:MAG: hypothetical protein GX493_02665 [Firmicutes bacterium]|nr:hypothetical protein [Bacillota bacterium]